MRRSIVNVDRVGAALTVDALELAYRPASVEVQFDELMSAYWMPQRQ
jgi:hypothetical protein